MPIQAFECCPTPSVVIVAYTLASLNPPSGLETTHILRVLEWSNEQKVMIFDRSHIHINISLNILRIHSTPLSERLMEIRRHLRPCPRKRDWIVAPSMALLKSKYESTYEKLLGVGIRIPRVFYEPHVVFGLSTGIRTLSNLSSD